MAEGRREFGKRLGGTALIGIGFFTMGLMDPLYDNFVPLFLEKRIGSMGVRNVIMTIDNVFAGESSSILSPPVTGLSADLFGIRSIFLIAAAFMLAANLVMGFVKRGGGLAWTQ
jgi:hypothetical protein